MEAECLLLFKRSTIGPFSDPDESNPHHIYHLMCLYDLFNIILASTLILLSDILLSGFEINIC